MKQFQIKLIPDIFAKILIKITTMKPVARRNDDKIKIFETTNSSYFGIYIY